MGIRTDGPTRPTFRSKLALLIALGCLGLGCGKVVAHGGQTAANVKAPTPAPKLHPSDLLPADLDIVLRLDLRRMRRSLGERVADELVTKAIEQSATEGLLGRALERASVVWLGLRLSDMSHGDRVIAVEFSREEPLTPDPNRWRRRPSAGEDLVVWQRARNVSRSGFERVYALGKRGAVFVTPVERDAVRRVLSGPDPNRGQPEARGLLSADYRPSKLSLTLEERYPSLAGILRGVERLRAHMDFDGDMVQLNGRMTCSSPERADKVLRFVEAIREGMSASSRHANTLADLSISRTDEQLRIRWTLPRRLIWSLLRQSRQQIPSTNEAATSPVAPSKK